MVRSLLPTTSCLCRDCIQRETFLHKVVVFVSMAFYVTGLNAHTSRDLFTVSDSVTVTNVKLMANWWPKMGRQPIAVPVKKIKVPPVNITVTVTNSCGVNRPYATQVFAAAAISERVQKYDEKWNFLLWRLFEIGAFLRSCIFFCSRSCHVIVALWNRTDVMCLAFRENSR